MGRTRRTDRHLPQRLYVDCGTYWFRPKGAKAVNLGRDLSEALGAYGRLLGPAPPVRTIGDAIDRYVREILPLKRSTNTRLDQARQLATLKKVFGTMLPDNITAQHCYRYLDERRNAAGESVPVAARQEISLLGHVIGKAIRWGGATANVVRNLERMPRHSRTRYVTDAEFDAVKAMAGPRLRAAIELAFLTGQRRGDLLALRRAQLTDAGVAFQQSKTGAGVLVEWTAALRSAIDACKRLTPQVPGEYLLRTRKGTPYTADGFSANWQRLMVKAGKAGIAHFTFHDLRAKAASDKRSLEEAAALLGHASSDTTRRIYKRNLTRATPTR